MIGRLRTTAFPGPGDEPYQTGAGGRREVSSSEPSAPVVAARRGRQAPPPRTSARTRWPATGSPVASPSTARTTSSSRCSRIARGGRLPSRRTVARTAWICARFQTDGGTGPAGPWTKKRPKSPPATSWEGLRADSRTRSARPRESGSPRAASYCARPSDPGVSVSTQGAAIDPALRPRTKRGTGIVPSAITGHPWISDPRGAAASCPARSIVTSQSMLEVEPRPPASEA